MRAHISDGPYGARLNESPSEKEGKSDVVVAQAPPAFCLNESPSEKEGKYSHLKIFRIAQQSPQ